MMRERWGDGGGSSQRNTKCEDPLWRNELDGFRKLSQLGSVVATMAAGSLALQTFRAHSARLSKRT